MTKKASLAANAHHDDAYFAWQRAIGDFGSIGSLVKFRDFALSTDKVNSRKNSATLTLKLLESDTPPRKLADLMNRYSHPRLGFNRDMDNSTWFGYDPDGKLPLYARHVRDVHVKDCNALNCSVPLRTGMPHFDQAFAQLTTANYGGNYNLQAARQFDDVAAGKAYLAFTRPVVDTLNAKAS